jgi:hypothetical protein
MVMPTGIHQPEERTRKKKKAPERNDRMQALTEYMGGRFHAETLFSDR